MLNRVSIAGRIVRDLEVRKTQAGISSASFAIATDRDYKDKDGNKVTDFINIVAWRSTADYVSKYAGKGSLIIVDGKLQVRSWKDDKGANHNATEVIADNIYICDSKRSNDGAANKTTSAKRSKPADVEPNSAIDSDEDLPF